MTAASFNELCGLESWSGNHTTQGRSLFVPCMESAANKTVADYSGRSRNGTSQNNTSTRTTTGPNSWLTAAQTCGPSDWINFGDYRADFTDKVSVFAWCKPSSADSFPMVFSAAKAGGDGSEGFELRLHSTTGQLAFSADESSGRISAISASSTVGAWSFACGVYNGSGVYINDDGTIVGPTSANGNIAFGTSGSTWRIGNRGTVGGFSFPGPIAGVGVFSRVLSSGEQGEAKNGPEPVVTSGSDSVSGTEQEGQTLSVSGATWGLPSPFSSGSNGTITYTYQWTRSNDGAGSGEANISGATSATYVPVSGDVGKYLRRVTRGTNDGGADVAADHASTFTGAIAATGGSAIFRRRLQSRIGSRGAA